MSAVFEWTIVGSESIDAPTVGLLRGLLRTGEVELPPFSEALVVPMNSEAGGPQWVQRTELSGREYVFRFGYNERASAWFFSLYEPEAEPFVLGLSEPEGDAPFMLLGKRLVVFKDLLQGIEHANRPPGMLVCLETSGRLIDPDTFESVATTHALVYLLP